MITCMQKQEIHFSTFLISDLSSLTYNKINCLLINIIYKYTNRMVYLEYVDDCINIKLFLIIDYYR